MKTYFFIISKNFKFVNRFIIKTKSVIWKKEINKKKKNFNWIFYCRTCFFSNCTNRKLDWIRDGCKYPLAIAGVYYNYYRRDPCFYNVSRIFLYPSANQNEISYYVNFPSQYCSWKCYNEFYQFFNPEGARSYWFKWYRIFSIFRIFNVSGSDSVYSNCK